MSSATDPDTDVAVRATGLVKAYRTPGAVRRQAEKVYGRRLAERTQAIAGLDFEVQRGEVYGILGPNGAGKTTLMKVLATILLPDSGTVQVLGHDLVKEAHALRPRIGVVLGEYERTFHWRLTGRQNLRFFADFYGLPQADLPGRIDEALAAVGLEDQGDNRFNVYSTGMKHRLALARGLLPHPDLLILDEPTAGLDAESSGQIAEVVRERAGEGTTVLYTTHRLHEAGVLCDRILVIDRGRRIAEATPEELVQLAKGAQVVEVRKRSSGPWEGSLVQPVARLEGVMDWETRGERLLFYTRNEDDVVANVVAALRDAGRGTLSVTVRPPDVEDAFLTLVQNARQAEVTT